MPLTCKRCKKIWMTDTIDGYECPNCGAVGTLARCDKDGTINPVEKLKDLVIRKRNLEKLTRGRT